MSGKRGHAGQWRGEDYDAGPPDLRTASPSPIARALSAKAAGLTLMQAWQEYGGGMTPSEWRQAFAGLWSRA